MPALSPAMEEGTLTKWHIKAGDTVSAGQVIAEIETDKATMEVEAVDEGEVLEILVPEGSENVKVNTPIARLSGDDAGAAPGRASSPAPEPKAAEASVTQDGGAASSGSGDPEKKDDTAKGPEAEPKDPEIPAEAELGRAA